MDERAQHARPLRGLLVAQFFGAFNDNALKIFVAFLAMRNLLVEPGTPAYEAASQAEATKAFVALTLPLIVLSLPAGQLADRFSKRTVIVFMKLVEVALMASAAISLYMVPTDPVLPFLVLGFMGAQSAFFAPAKYGILPELLPHERLSAGNGLMQMWTMLAIIGGTVAGGALSQAFSSSSPWVAGVLFTVLAVVGVGAAFTVPRVAPAGTRNGLITTVRQASDAIRADRVLRLAILGAAYLWGIATLLGQNIVVYSKATLGLSDFMSGLPLGVLGAGLGIGSVVAGKLSAGKVEFGLIPMGALGMAVITLVLGIWAPAIPGTLLLMGLLGLSGGLILVPIHSVIQWRAPAARRGSVIASSNLLTYSSILAASLVAYALAINGVSPRGILIATALAVGSGTVWSLWLLPEAFLRLGFVLVSHTVYKLTVAHPERVPEEGPALLVPNHVSFIDGLLVLASTDRPVRFVIDSAYYHMPLLKPFMLSLQAIPISLGEGPKPMLRALREAGKRLDEGEVVCIFPEGQITRTGMLGPFRRGFQRIIGDRDAPIIPVSLDRVWGSIFSRAGGRFVTKLPQRIPYPVTVAFGEPLPAGARIGEVRAAVRELTSEAWKLRKAESPPLYRQFIRQARRRPWRFSMGDVTRPRVSRLGTLIGAIVLARLLRPHWEGQRNVGILLPPSVGGAIVNLAAALSGRTSVNLNYTAGKAGMTSAARQAGLETVVTSGMFVAKAELDLPDGVEPLWLEDLRKHIGRGDKLVAMLVALLGTHSAIERACGSLGRPSPDDLATIIFSSGSTGEPKGVQLTHFNIMSNVEGAGQAVQFGPSDTLLGILPFFHSFGYMATLWLVTNSGMGVVYHPNPLDALAIGQLVQRYRATALIATPTFLRLYLRRCTPAQFGSLRLVVAGAEKLSAGLGELFLDTFGLKVLEGYGATECAPVIALNAPDFRGAGYYQPGSRRGTVGQPLPGVAVRIVDPETHAPRPAREAGMILVAGPNVMKGYLNRDDLTDEAIRDGWYVTGDIGAVDEDGFLTITDRLARFSKIGGEMVPHGVVEEALHQAADTDDHIFSVTAIRDEKKGERLAVVHTAEEDTIAVLLEDLQSMGLPNLFVPRKDDFVKVTELPVLGTGKTDLRAVRDAAARALLGE